MIINKEEVRKRKERLIEIKAELKEELFGIDTVIDRVVDSIQTWYLVPEVITHPIIINLFGMTGTGKTQLVRSLVKKLEYQHKFVEIQMDGISGGSGYMSNSLAEILQSSSIQEKEAGVILLDEFQRFRTVKDNGDDVEVKRFQDVWQLLSDGKFGIDSSYFNQLLDSMAYSEYSRQSEKEEEEEEDDDDDSTTGGNMEWAEGSGPLISHGEIGSTKKKKKKVERKYSIYPSEARTLKRLFKLKAPLVEVMQMKHDEVLELKRTFLADNVVDCVDYSKCLIFICGNLDSAFQMSGNVENSDTDADIFYQLTKGVSIAEIKKTLATRFKPEQIARLGNNVIVYPSLSKSAYQQIIEAACQKYVDLSYGVSGIKFLIAPSVYEEIYNNSVYPSQGTRPVFSSIHKIFASPLSDVMLWGLENDYQHISLMLDGLKSELVCFADHGNVKRVKVSLDIQEQKKTNSEDFNSLITVHETGHALAFALLYNYCPSEIVTNLASFSGGYVGSAPLKVETSVEVLKRVKVALAGICAEEIVFGKENLSTGCSGDIIQATKAVAEYVRRLGMHKTLGTILATSQDGLYVEKEMAESNTQIEHILQWAKKDVKELLENNHTLLALTFKELHARKKLTCDEYFEILNPHVPELQKSAYEMSTPYKQLMEKFE